MIMEKENMIQFRLDHIEELAYTLNTSPTSFVNQTLRSR